jgi:hypothetical protein
MAPAEVTQHTSAGAVTTTSGTLQVITKHTNPFHLLYHITAELNMGYSQEFILVKI